MWNAILLFFFFWVKISQEITLEISFHYKSYKKKKNQVLKVKKIRNKKKRKQ